MKMRISHFDGQQYRPRSMSKTMTSSESMRMNLRVSSAIESFSSCVIAFQTWNWKPGKITLWRAGVRTGTLITILCERESPRF